MINALVTASVRLGVGAPQRHLLTVAGRTSKALYTTPVSIVSDGPNKYLVAPYGERDWVRNARAAGSVRLTRGRRSEQFAISQLAADQAGPLLRRYLKLEPIVQPYFKVRPDASAEAFVAEAASHPVFRLTPKP